MHDTIFHRRIGRRAARIAIGLAAACAGWTPLPGVPTVGGAAWAQTCPVGSQVREVGQAYRFSRVGRNYLWTVYRKPGQARVGFRHEEADGSWFEEGTINRWPSCPAAPTSVQIVAAQGQSRVCTRVCLSDGRVELQCPLARFVMTRLSPLRLCVDTTASDVSAPGPRPGPTPEPRPRPCRFRIGCQDYDTCVSCCAENGDNLVECGLGCLFAGGDVGTPRCQDPFPPESGAGGGDALSCVAIPGYPNWCDRALPAF